MKKEQSNYISVGDIVYLYITAPVSAILYNYDDGKVHMNQVMKLKRIEKYELTLLTLEKLKEHGISVVCGLCKMPNRLLGEIKKLNHE